MKFRAVFAATTLAFSAFACAADDSTDEPTAEELDITSTKTGVSLEASDNGATVSVEQGKNVIVNLMFGGFDANAYGKYEVTSTDKTFGYPTISTKSSKIPDMPITEKLLWRTSTFMAPGEVHKVVLTSASRSGLKRTFKFTVKIVAPAPPTSKVGQRCGGFGGARCADGLDCVMSEPVVPDVPGICRARSAGAKAGEMCSGIAGIRCADGLDCILTAPVTPDKPGVCTR